jgi:iron-sulfur cluster repair protein YtfE (RIC family)
MLVSYGTITNSRQIAPLLKISIARIFSSDNHLLNFYRQSHQEEPMSHRLAAMSVDPFSHLLQGMVPFHNSFRMHHAEIQARLATSQTLSKRDLSQMMRTSLQLCNHLDTHHMIEETYIFPLLAKKMTQFAPSSQHTKEHDVMHATLEKLQTYSRGVLGRLQDSQGSVEAGTAWPKDVYDSEKFSTLVDDLAQALFPHLAAEEESLSPASLRKAGFTAEELSRIPL